MKKLFFFFTTYAFLIILLTSCEGGKEIRTELSQDQLDFLLTVPSGTALIFNENGQLYNYTVSGLGRTTYKSEDRGSMVAKPSTYYNEHGEVNYYKSENRGPSIYLKANASSKSKNIELYDPVLSVSSDFLIKTDRTIPFRTINGITYTDVVISVDSYRNDTLFWKESIGILGWKKASQNYTAYRVF